MPLPFVLSPSQKAAQPLQRAEIVAGKAAVTLLALYLAYVGATCPCVPLFACHRKQMYLSTLAIAVAVLLFNGWHFRNKTD